MRPSSIASIDLVACALLLAVFAVNLYRDATQSISTAEAVAFDRWVRPPLRDVLPQPYDPHNRVLKTLLVKRSVALFRLSEFSFRLPELLGGGLCLWAVYRLSRRFLGTGALLLGGIALLALNPPGLALGLFLWAIELMLAENLNLAGICLGLSAAADLAFLFPAAALGIAFLTIRLAGEPSRWVSLAERFVIPAVTTGFIFLAIPLSHAQPGSLTGIAKLLPLWLVPSASVALLALIRKIESQPVKAAALAIACVIAAFYQYHAWPRDTGARALVQALRRDAAGRHVEIGASRDLEPILSFYRARYRLANWEPMRHKPLDGHFDYYMLNGHDAALVSERHLQVIYRGSGFVLAR